MQCANGPTVFDGRLFVRDFCRELQRLAKPEQPGPYYPQPTWWRALALADERDRIRFISYLNASSDGDDAAAYYASQHTSDLRTDSENGAPTSTFALQVDTCRPRPSLHAQRYIRYGRRRTDNHAQCTPATTG